MSRFQLPCNQTTALLLSAILAAASAAAAELVYQENFNTDGATASPARYTIVGGEVFEIDRRAELNDANQEGPVYWARNTEVSFTGVPAPTAGRRMVMAWDQTITDDVLSADMRALLDSSLRWLLNNKVNATIVVSPAGANLGALGDRLLAAGHTLVDDDTSIADLQLHTLGDMLIHAVGAGSSRGARSAMPVLAIVSADYDDLLVSSIGTPAAFEPGPATIAAPGHPAAGGKTGSFPIVTGSFNWQLLGSQLPGTATTLATFTQAVPPSVTSIADVDAMIAGTKQATKTTEQVPVLDFSDATAGNWFDDAAIPGGAAGNWGIVADGKLNVTAAGTYSFALGTDDGGRVQIDLNRNGTFDAGETIITDAGPHGHQISYGNATFSATGLHDIRVVGYNSGGGGSFEVSVANTAGGGKTDLATAPENWEVLGTIGSIAPVRAEGTFTVSSFVATGAPAEITHPFILLLNGPNDTPPGSVFGGGPFTGFEGTGFFGGAGLNKWTLPDTNDRYVTLRPINVAGKTNVQLTIGVAGTFLDFEPSNGQRGGADYLEVAVDTDGAGPNDFQRLIFFTPPSGADKFMDDRQTRPTNPTRLGLEFKDVTYPIPAGATDLIVEVRGATTWWNEIVAFDNIRITAGADGGGGDPTISIAKNGANVVVTFANGTLQTSPALGTAAQWTDVTASGGTHTIPAGQGNAAFFRVIRR